MTRTVWRRAPVLVLLSAAMGGGAASACELDGLSHGYGPMAALFAGAHRYQSLNGVEEEPPEPPPAAAPTPDAPAEAAARPSAPPAPRRSFVAWAKAKPKPPGTGEAPATWQQGAGASADPPTAPPQRAEPDEGEQRQSPPRGGSVP